MTNFNKTGKTGLSSLPNRSIRFWQFQSETEEGAKLKDLKIQIVLKQENGLKCINESRQNKIKQEAKVVKTGLSDFSRTGRVLLEFEIQFVQERFTRV